LEEMKNISDNKIDLLFCDLPWAATSCKWDCAIDLKLFWKEINRICKINCPMFFCCNAKFGNTLINSNPKNFRYDLVWVKSSPVGFLNAKKMPMKKHELIYVFYRKLPFYNLSSHKHKFISEKTEENIIKTDLYSNKNIEDKRELYRNKPNQYDPPLPTSIIKDELFIRGKDSNTQNKDIYNYNERLKNGKLYHHSRKLQKGDEPIYDPPLPTSIIKEIDNKYTPKGGNHFEGLSRLGIITNKPIYDPPLPDSILEIKSEKGKHATQKPVKLIEWILKYYSKEGDTILDPTMGSGSSGVACMNMNRNFIGIEKDKKIFEVAKERLKIT